MKRHIQDTKAYESIIGTFKKHKSGITLADVAAGTGLGLNRVRELVPVAADEYSARLEVTQSGEILYSFPHGFSSRYRGIAPACRRGFTALARFAVAAGKLLFKAWIMVMLIGYFVLFIAIALAALVLSMTAKNNRNSSGHGGGGMNASFGIFNLIIRIWFYSELLGTGRRSSWQGGGWDARSSAPKKKGRPLHKAIFSFVFGDDDPNLQRQMLEKKEFLAYIRKRRGVVSLPELMILAGKNSQSAESQIASLCAEFGGSPEVTEEGTIVYRFDEILISSAASGTNTGAAATPSAVPLYKKLRVFSSNPQKLNVWFALINGVNLLFGSYFLYNASAIGVILTEEALQAAGMYGMVYYFLHAAGANPMPIIQIGLGLIPLLFSAFFWLIPALRSVLLKKENETIRMDNFRGFFFSRIWTSPEGFQPASVEPHENECRPRNLAAAKNTALKEMSAYSMPDVTMEQESGHSTESEVFTFSALCREKDALETYRRTVDTTKAMPGETVFDSGV
ncbi:MAG: hypothetical protein FWD91_04600 [Treponema sp.]|nr:hypothetical protein [Treponema sp.]